MHDQVVLSRAVGAKDEGDQTAWLVGGGKERGARSVAKEHAGRSVLEVEVARHRLRAHHEDALVSAGRDELGRGDQPVDETRAGRGEIERPRSAEAELRLNETRD